MATNTLARVPDDVLVRRLDDGESVLLDLRSERYYGLDTVSTAMWEALTSQETFEVARAARRRVRRGSGEDTR